SLLKIGFPAAKLSIESLRVFADGKPEPVVISPGPDAPTGLKPGVYFWGRGGNSPYSKVKVYWVTADASLPVEPMARITTDRPRLDLPERTTTQRTQIFERDRAFKIRHGSFMAIEEMAWVDTLLVKDEPFQIPLALPGLHAGH